jgi:hypothetical protein
LKGGFIMLKNILAVIGAVTVAAVAYVAFSDHVIVKIEPDEKYPEDPRSRKSRKKVAKPSEPKKEDHKLTFDELVRKMDESEEHLAETEAAATAKDNDEDDEPETKVEKIKVEDKPAE